MSPEDRKLYKNLQKIELALRETFEIEVKKPWGKKKNNYEELTLGPRNYHRRKYNNTESGENNDHN